MANNFKSGRNFNRLFNTCIARDHATGIAPWCETFRTCTCPKGSRPPPITPFCLELITSDWDNDIGSFCAPAGATSRLRVLNLFLSPQGMCLDWITSHEALDFTTRKQHILKGTSFSPSNLQEHLKEDIIVEGDKDGTMNIVSVESYVREAEGHMLERFNRSRVYHRLGGTDTYDHWLSQTSGWKS